ncbi:MAG: CPBP family intramembrane metalloprotease [Limnochordales bacterium]|nr:CPBP family intramembrane metalloprotease [Limnochordales bacterium]
MEETGGPAGLASPRWQTVTHRDLMLSLLIGILVVPNLFGLAAEWLLTAFGESAAGRAARGSAFLIAGFAQEITLIGLAILLVRRRLAPLAEGRNDGGSSDELADWIGLGDPPAFSHLVNGASLGLMLLVVESIGSGLVYAVLVALFGPERAQEMLAGSQAQMLNWMAATPEPWQQYALVLLLAAFGPLAEEIWFRGVLYPSWRARFGVGRAMLAQSAVFGLLHLNLIAYPALFLVGIVLTLIYERRRSLWPAVFAHATLNAVVLAVLILQRGWPQSPGW